MARLIDADALKANFNGILGCSIGIVIDAAPTVDAMPIVHGHWTKDHACSVCGAEAIAVITNIRPSYDYDWEERLVETGEFEYDTEWRETNYCPNCGTKLREV